MGTMPTIFLILITLILTGLILALQSVLNRAGDNIRNKRIQKQERINPPKQERLADRLNQSTKNKNR